FHEVAGLNESAGVYVDGVRVGLAEKIQWQGDRQVLVRLRVNKDHLTVPQGSRFTILTNGVVGARYVEIVLPHLQAGQPVPPAISERQVQIGEDPVRPELAVNNLAIGLSKIDMEKLARDFEADRARLIRAADQLSVLANKSMPVVDKALPLEIE